MLISEIKHIFAQDNIEYVGCCDIEKLKPFIECRAKNFIPQNAKTVITSLFPYYIGEYKNRNISRYALGIDYHNIVGEILNNCIDKIKKIYPNSEFIAFVDNSPIDELKAAYYSELGDIGKNNQLINADYGTYTFIGEIITDLKIVNDNKKCAVKCLNCNKCINNCPTKSLGNNSFDKEKCRSFITQKKRELTEFEFEEILKGGFVWGCDICNDVCPFNKNPKLTPIKKMYENIVPVITEENVNMHIKNKAFEYRGIKTISRNISIISGKE